MSEHLRTVIVAIGLVCGSVFAVYPSVVQLDMTDPVRHRTFRASSTDEYRQALAGQAPFPYQWRMLGPWIVRAGERLTGADPHAVDVVAKVALLSLSAAALALFAARVSSTPVAVAVVGFYFAATAGAYASLGYSIYYTSDYVMIAGWFWAVYLLSTRRLAAAALVTFVAAWAKETMVLVPILAALMWWRTRRGTGALVLLTLAFALPTILLRLIYRAPLGAWVWWDAALNNVPFLDPTRVGWTLRYNVKVLAFYNVGWWLAGRAAWRTRDPFVRDLGVTLAIYLVLAYAVVYIRELRHVLPLAILILPLALRDLIASHRTT